MGDIQNYSHWPSWQLPVKRELVSVTEKHPCGYLENRLATFRAFDAADGNWAAGLSPEIFQKLLDSGFRRSGSIIYQPMCAGCRQCVPLRVPVESFVPSKSQRRVLRKNQDLVVRVGAPEVTREKWELYERYQRQWHKKNIVESEDLPAFINFLYRSPMQSLEFEYRNKWGRLFGVGITDVLPLGLSSVYFYFDPTQGELSLGTYSAMYEIQWVKERGMGYWYAGYWIKGTGSMAYKSRFKPAEILHTDGIWRRLEE